MLTSTNELVMSPEFAAPAWALSGDEILRRRADSLIGNIATGACVGVEVVPEDAGRIMGLAEAIDRARVGDAEALKLVRANVTTDYFERAYKTGFVSEVVLEKTPDGKLIQNGQTHESVHVNSLLHLDNEKLKERSKIEALNAVRDQHYADTGLFEDHARVVISMVHDQMTDKEADEVGFFTHTRSISLQLMTEHDGKIIIQSAFVAGRENMSGDSFDREAAVRFAKKLNLDFSGLGSEGILASPIIIHKKRLPDLVLSAVQLFDESATEVTGQPKFFGRDDNLPKTDADYRHKFQESLDALASVRTDIEGVVASLLAANPATPIAATAKLAELNDRLLKSRIVTDRSIDSRVLGEEVAHYVDHARYLAENNLRHHEITILQSRIELEGRSSSCPGGSKSVTDKDLLRAVDPNVILEDQGKGDDSKEKPEDCEFVSKECPKCGAKNVKTTCKDGRYYGECGCHS